MSDRVKTHQGQEKKLLYLRGSNPEYSNTMPPTGPRLYLRGMSNRSDETDQDRGDGKSPRGKSSGNPSTPNRRSTFNPQADPFTPTTSSSSTDPSSAGSSAKKPSVQDQREERLRQINLIEDERDREDAMNDFIWDQHTDWTAEELEREKEELELEERRRRFARR
ncbi:hypothetical protein FGSG_13767 [Fusarium graminearum PH-1]|uniref:Chromosome 1, complete genome n=1 Tax=Gibberella zeae (strain ATCC MYA-4620 / CBS 123657 / FGSC 9075 / NRRL 31084 / PH-1) TaxID=229533 RepID=I1SA86_GIBZE|nr:hypothetical protein FGSG_13767 [Fusarium graminearum PH-1]ESU17200.1 hypothetical protein FGSG_13767 [Fusarium graminearum PH-1]EYB31452.1 hypothetical protein FG05_13767 [Fusarium graminearum]CEF75905.1 unnamed protein product [Fusarium graminearum]|eukprot:XP_011319462.1 hypothetical protein FGSG_13767 [Fusarium graminearum PH-1]